MNRCSVGLSLKTGVAIVLRFATKFPFLPAATLRHSRAFACFAIFLVLGFSFVGCDVPPRPPLDASELEPSPTQTMIQTQKAETLEAPGASFDGRWETWDAYFVGQKRVGYTHVVAAAVDLRPSADVRYQLENTLFVKQGRSRILQRLVQSSTETYDGRLENFEAALHVGPAVTRYDGAVEVKNLKIETTRGSERTVRNVPWQTTFRGLVAVEQSLRNDPLTKRGEKRMLKMLLPGSYEVVTTRLQCFGKAAVPLIDGTMGELYEINSEMEIDEKGKTNSTIWINEEGEIVRTFSPSMHMVGYRTDEETALNFPDNEPLVAKLAVDGKLDRPSEAMRVGFKISPNASLQQTDAKLDFPAAPEQYVRPAEDGSFQVLVSRRPEKVGKGFLSHSLQPTDADRKPNFFVDSTAVLVRRFADATIGSVEMTDLEVAEELTRTTNTLIGDKETKGMSRASEIAQSGLGDSTEHAILLAALLRAREIPARIVFGLKYVAGEGESNQMVYHAWTIAWVDDQWINLDATEGKRPAADRLVLAHSNLSGRHEYDDMVPFLNLIQGIQVTILGAQY